MRYLRLFERGSHAKALRPQGNRKEFSIGITALFLVLLALAGHSNAQDLSPTGSVRISAQTQASGKKTILDRKRFYLMRGGLKDNETLVEKLKETEAQSRDCYYRDARASEQFMCWLKTEKFDCESPYCRDITMEDVNAVPEFTAAYKKGLRQYGRSDIARKWLTTNLPFALRFGFYRMQKQQSFVLASMANPLQSVMTDSLQGAAYFIDIGLNLTDADGKKKKTETFLISNLLPAEIGEKSYVWACEVEIGPEKQAVLNLQAAEKTKKCVVVTKDLPVCKSGACQAK